MAVQIVPILKALATIIANSAPAVAQFAGMRKSAANLKVDERMRAIEEEVARVGVVVVGLAQQAQAIAEELRAQAVLNESQEKKMNICLGLSIIALCLGCTALIITLRQ